MQQGDEGSGEMDGGENGINRETSKMSSSREQCQMISEESELPIIIGP
jgi:hypothetical protein